jgi:hypothetical protein
LDFIVDTFLDEVELYEYNNGQNEYICCFDTEENTEQVFRKIKQIAKEHRFAQTLRLDCVNIGKSDSSMDNMSDLLSSVFEQAFEYPPTLEIGDNERIITDGLYKEMDLLRYELKRFSEQRMPLIVLLRAFRYRGKAYTIAPELHEFISKTVDSQIIWMIKDERKTSARDGAQKQQPRSPSHTSTAHSNVSFQTMFHYLENKPTSRVYNQDPRVKIVKAIQSRRGQQAFRKELLRQFQGRCCITGCRVDAVLEAAHIDPYSMDQNMSFSNGLILRADLHTLFDFGLLAIDTDQEQVLLAPSLQKSVDYGALKGHQIFLPDEPADDAAKRKAALDEHLRKRRREWLT